MPRYDVAVIGGGPAGIMAAITAARHKKNVILIEKKGCLGRKVLITGNGRCNITNNASIERFIRVFGKQGNFLKPSFFSFFNNDMIKFFEQKGLRLKIEDNGCIFPITDNASSIIKILKIYLLENKVDVNYNARTVKIDIKKNKFSLILENNTCIYSERIIMATGGISYKKTGSSGDGFKMLKKLNHTIQFLKPALVPLIVKEKFAKDLKGLTLQGVKVVYHKDRKKIKSELGDILFTHFGVSGPLVLDLSRDIVFCLQFQKKLEIFIDLKPEYKIEELEKILITEFNIKGALKLKNILKQFLSNRLVETILSLSAIHPNRKGNQTSNEERRTVLRLIKGLPLTVIGSLSIENAMVTDGGVSIDEINSKTLESKIVPGLYFAGEIIDGCGPCGGFNLQQAFSTGYLAGKNAGLG